jgi:hypothetical protein
MTEESEERGRNLAMGEIRMGCAKCNRLINK